MSFPGLYNEVTPVSTEPTTVPTISDIRTNCTADVRTCIDYIEKKVMLQNR